jgi:hypothetical protein
MPAYQLTSKSFGGIILATHRIDKNDHSSTYAVFCSRGNPGLVGGENGGDTPQDYWR